MIVDETKRILNEYNTRAKKSFGQNFLINKDIIKGIAEEANLNGEDYVIEIGPGIGSLTEFLCLGAKHVLCYEIDEDMYNILSNTLSKYDNKTIILGDFLKQDVKEDINRYLNESNKVKVIANLPYYITTPIMFKLLEIDNICEFVFMVQKEMGDRFVGKVNTKDYNALSVYMKYYTDTFKAINVSRANFMPAPNVDSVVLHSVINKKDFGLKNEKEFLRFTRNAFAQRRKTMVNNISNAYKVSKSVLETKLNDLHISSTIRSEALSLEELVKVYKYLFE